MGPVHDPGVVVYDRLIPDPVQLDSRWILAPCLLGRGGAPTLMKRRLERRLVAILLVALAIVIVVAEPFPKGEVLLELTANHGVDVGDLPAIALLLVAACLAV